MSPTPARISTLSFPHDDLVFAELVGRALRRLEDAGTDPTPDDLATQLRIAFPRAVVVAREPLADLWPRGQVWYVYRDGAVLSPRPEVVPGREGDGPREDPSGPSTNTPPASGSSGEIRPEISHSRG